MSSSNPPCAACKCLRRRCTQECVFAPYFPPDNPHKFTSVHKVFGASNVAKLLNELNSAHREHAVNSLAYEAEYRLRDPVYGCVGLISILQHKLKQVQQDLEAARKELSHYIGLFPAAGPPTGYILPSSSFDPAFQMMPYSMQPMAWAPHGQPQLQHQQQFFEVQQLVVAAAREQEMLRSYEQQQNDLRKFGGRGFDDGAGQATDARYNQLAAGGSGSTMPPSLALRTSDHSIQQHTSMEKHMHQLLLQTQATELLNQQQSLTAQVQTQLVQAPARGKSEEGKSVGPSC